MNLCRGCGLDFGSLSAFDRHRVGKHAYTFSEGLRMETPVEDGRRCLDVSELSAAGWRPDGNGRWRTPGSDWNASLRSAEREISASEGLARGFPTPGDSDAEISISATGGIRS